MVPSKQELQWTPIPGCLRSVLWCDAFVLIVLSDKPRQNQGRGLVDHRLAKASPPPTNFIAGRPKAALLFWFFGDFRGGVSLFIVTHVI